MKLKRCPICNGEACLEQAFLGTGRYTFRYHVVCEECGLEAPEYDEEKDAIKMWNDRSKAEAALKKKLKKELAKERDFSIIPSYPIPIGKFEPYKAVTITITAHSGV